MIYLRDLHVYFMIYLDLKFCYLIQTKKVCQFAYLKISTYLSPVSVTNDTHRGIFIVFEVLYSPSFTTFTILQFTK